CPATVKMMLFTLSPGLWRVGSSLRVPLSSISGTTPNSREFGMLQQFHKQRDSVDSMGNRLRALVLGAGYAGQGHAQALRLAGVEIAAMASRTADVGAKVAASMQIPRCGSDWRGLLIELKPDIVAVGTPGGTHREMIGAALEAGCHVLADKPLATTAADA